ncbi:hypothetical protein NHN17_25595, partial [Photobacterium sp. ZSDE20]
WTTYHHFQEAVMELSKCSTIRISYLDLADWKFDFTVNGQNQVYSWPEMEETLSQRYLMPDAALTINDFNSLNIDSEFKNEITLNSIMTK